MNMIKYKKYLKDQLPLRDRARITSPSLFAKALKTLGILQTERELIIARPLRCGK